MFYADDIGEFITLDRESGEILRRVKTLEGLGGITAVKGPKGEFLVLGNYDPLESTLQAEFRKFMFRAAHGTMPMLLRPKEKTMSWVLLDAQSGELLASITHQASRVYAGSVALLKQEHLSESPYGKLTFLATGEEGILTLEWLPRRKPQ
jgi:hypothetical protein